MLERIASLPAGIDGVKAVGKVSQQDYQQVLEPLIDEARRADRRLRLVYQFGPDFESFTAGGAWEDASVGLRSLRLIEGLAIVSDMSWIRDSSRLLAFFMPGPVRHFGNPQFADAVTWLQSLPEPAGVSHRLLADSGVIVLEVKQALRARFRRAGDHGRYVDRSAWAPAGARHSRAQISGVGEPRRAHPTHTVCPRSPPEDQAGCVRGGWRARRARASHRRALRPGGGEDFSLRCARLGDRVGGGQAGHLVRVVPQCVAMIWVRCWGREPVDLRYDRRRAS